MNLNKDYLLTESKTFCMLPWIHLHTSPSGVAAPCCVSSSCSTSTGVGNSKNQSLMELVNSEKMNQLRLDMVTEIKNEECTKCYQHDHQGISSHRVHANREYQKFYDDAITHTNINGSLTEFKMKYFDIRFNNICNMKCRTCNQEFSTQWEQENLKYKVPYAREISKNDNKKFLNDVVNQIEHMDTAYFAGGEPLITEEHYVLLEEMIRAGRTDIILRYNTNMSNIRFKNKDLLGLWEKFSNKVQVYASIDHYGERAEYIRSGTDWAVVESNFHQIKKSSNISLCINTVLSVFNTLTIGDFYQYLIDTGMYACTDNYYSLYCMSSPEHLAPHILPSSYKEKGIESLNAGVSYLRQHEFSEMHIAHIKNVVPWVNTINSWDLHKDQFISEINRLDNIRGDSFTKTFPELAGLMIE